MPKSSHAAAAEAAEAAAAAAGTRNGVFWLDVSTKDTIIKDAAFIRV
jgi:hypothetical protein